MKRLTIILLSSFFIAPLMAQGFTEVANPFPFNAFGLSKDSYISAADLNSPVTDSDRISVSKDGHLEVNGKRLRIFGTNLSEFPKTHKDAEFAAKAMANQGFNCIRFHHTDADWSNCFIKTLDNGKRVLNKQRLDDFDYFFFQLKQNGIYSNINLLTGRTYTTNDGLDPDIKSVRDWKGIHSLGFWNEDGKKIQKNWAKELLTHVNPYTGLSYLEDPAVAIVEINNENGLLHSYLGGDLDFYKDKYWQDLEDKWNEWLKKQGLSYNSLAAKYNTRAKKGENIIPPGARWNMENHNGAKSVYSSENNVHTIKVENNGGESWHIQFNCARLSMEENKIYTVSFTAKASKPTDINVSLMQAHDPWRNAGFSKKVSLTTGWNTYTYTVSGISTDSNLRINFGDMGLSKGITFSYKDISISEGGEVLQIHEGAKSTAGSKTVAMPYNKEYQGMSAELKNLVMNFLWDTEEAYWKEMASYVRNTLGSKSLLMGTILGCSSASIQSCFDIIDTHAYWNHPVFPAASWNVSNYYVENKTLTKADADNTLTNCAKYRVYGKPFCVSEYDHPYPNQFQAEMYPMLASFASFQDWDALFTFCYTLPKTKDGQTDKIDGYFDQGNTPVRTCAAPVASRIFRQFLVTPGKTALYVPVTAKDEKALLYKNSNWSIGDTSLYGMNKTLGLTHRIGIVLTDDVSGAKLPEGARLLTKDAAAAAGQKLNAGFSDTKELYWDENTGIFITCNDNVMITAACAGATLPVFPPEWLKENRLLPMTNNKDFGVVAAVKKDGNFIGFSGSWNGNNGEALAKYGTKGNAGKFMTTRDRVSLTTAPGLGKGPAMALGADGKIQFTGKAKANFYYAALSGNPEGKAQSGNQFTLKPDSKSLWFVIKLK